MSQRMKEKKKQVNIKYATFKTPVNFMQCLVG